jgi:SanA protein
MKRLIKFNTKKVLLSTGALLALGLITIIGCYQWIERYATEKIYDEASEVPSMKVGLVLGTSKLNAYGQPNPYFERRMDAAAALYREGKVLHLLVSGDNSRKGYNEPKDMKAALVERAVPEAAITLDYAGFRTLDSVVRCKTVFQQQEMVVISQAFHNKRAIFLARKKGIKAIGYNAETPSIHWQSKVRYREYLARVKAVIDLYLLNKEPKYHGEKIDLPIS